MSLRIEDYALIGDTQSAALVGRDGSIDWMCWPRFDSEACFAALLGHASHGRWSLSPVAQVVDTKRRYRPDTLVLETELSTATGTVRIVDCMPIRDQAPNLVRVVQGVRGTVPMQMELIIRPDYGAVVPWVQRVDGMLHATGGPHSLCLRCDVPTHGKELTTVAAFDVREGECTPFVLSWHASHLPIPPAIDATAAVRDTERWWQDWCSRNTCPGQWREQVMRSLITLKALTYSPTGGIVAAATTSLPEQIGGVRNWDYRCCWLRDATFTLYAFMLAGYTQEASDWIDWLLRAVAGDPSQLQIVYGLAGERRLPELELPWLPGYEDSRPVRIGNAAQSQHQLDVYGEVMDAMHVARRSGIKPEPAAWELQKALVRFLETSWREPDYGIWEVRGPRRHFTHSKVMAWVAVDRAVKAIERFHLQGPLECWRRVRDEIHSEVCERGFNAERGAFTQFYGSPLLDASVLMIPLVGFLPAHDPRMQSTVAVIERDLCLDGFVQRYSTEAAGTVDGISGNEGAFLACSFWLADNYALLGQYDKARALFTRLLTLCNDVGLLSEEYDPEAKRMLGNFPQAFSHVGLINTAFNLSKEHGAADERPR